MALSTLLLAASPYLRVPDFFRELLFVAAILFPPEGLEKVFDQEVVADCLRQLNGRIRIRERTATHACGASSHASKKINRQIDIHGEP
jgi:hypothetical protein